MKFFTKQEIIGVSAILLLVGLITGINMNDALLRSRDVQRKADLGGISNALHSFFEEYGFLPPSEDGYIKACRGEGYEEVLTEFEKTKRYDYSQLFDVMRPCVWGADPLPDLLDDDAFFMSVLYVDPQASKNISYHYISSTKRFQLYTYLEEGSKSVGYNEGIVERNLLCGGKVCSFGKSFAETPLDKSIEQYEMELREKNEREKQMRLKNMLQ